MIPFNDVEPNRYTVFPFMTIALITINLLIMGLENIWLYQDFQRFVETIFTFGLVPAAALQQQGGGAVSSITSLFLHADIWHVLGNMVALWVFGRRVEDACGPWRFLFFYVTCGLAAGIVFIAAESTSLRPVIGASGAVYGIMGAYLVLYPQGRIHTWFLFWVFRIRAIFLVPYFLLSEIPLALDSLLNAAQYQTAHWAHMGGFFGCLLVFFFLRPDAFYRYRNELPL
ncbi:MAG: rhomboid family intramembrane serine protease [Chloroflexota bacterium]|jgi:membrane associated rhomboid family serine protease